MLCGEDETTPFFSLFSMFPFFPLFLLFSIFLFFPFFTFPTFLFFPFIPLPFFPFFPFLPFFSPVPLFPHLFHHLSSLFHSVSSRSPSLFSPPFSLLFPLFSFFPPVVHLCFHPFYCFCMCLLFPHVGSMTLHEGRGGSFKGRGLRKGEGASRLRREEGASKGVSRMKGGGGGVLRKGRAERSPSPSTLQPFALPPLPAHTNPSWGGVRGAGVSCGISWGSQGGSPGGLKGGLGEEGGRYPGGLWGGLGPKEWGPQRVGGQKPRKNGCNEGWEPKISRFFPSAATISLFVCLSWCLLVEFWWCLKRRGPEMCTFGVLGPEAAGGSHDSPRAQTLHISRPRRFKHHQNSTAGHQKERRKKENGGGRGEKKSAKFWAPQPSGPPPSGPRRVFVLQCIFSSCFSVSFFSKKQKD